MIVSNFFLELLTGSILFIGLSDQTQSNILNGQHLLIASKSVAPYIFFEHDAQGNITNVDGFVYHVVEFLSLYYNFTYTLLEPKDNLIGGFVNNSWTGLIKTVMNHDADIAAFPLTPTEARSTVVDFTSPFLVDLMAALVPAPTEGNRFEAIVKPFRQEVWIMVIASLMIVAIATWFIAKILKHHEMIDNFNDFKAELNFLFFFGILCFQSQQRLPSRKAGTFTLAIRLIVGVWCLAAVLIIIMFNSNLKSSVATPKYYPIVETLAELADSPNIQPATFQSHYFESLLLEAKTGTYKKLGDSLRNFPDNRLSSDYFDLGKLSSKVAESGKLAVFMEELFLNDVIGYHLKKTNLCDLTLMKERFIPTWESFALPKKSPYFYLIDEGISLMRETGILDRWTRFYTKKANRCDGENLNRNQVKVSVATLIELGGVFLVLFLGILISLMALIFEQIVSFCWILKRMPLIA